MDRARADEALDQGREALTTAAGDQATTIRIAADSASTRVLDEPKTYCPGRLPCIGMTGQRIAVPVHVVAADDPARIGEKVGEITAVYCPDCRSMKADARS